jgi:hypothetical protein
MASIAEVAVAPKKEKSPKRAGGRRSRQAAADQVRYFVGKPCHNNEQPKLEREVPSEADGLVAAFKSDGSLFVLSEYSVTQKIEGGRVTLEKERAAPASPRVSIVNAS